MGANVCPKRISILQPLSSRAASGGRPLAPFRTHVVKNAATSPGVASPVSVSTTKSSAAASPVSRTTKASAPVAVDTTALSQPHLSPAAVASPVSAPIDQEIIAYLDNAATTPLFPEVMEAVVQAMAADFGNAHSVHSVGKQAQTIVNTARKTIADALGVSPHCLVFTSGGSESNCLAIRGVIDHVWEKRRSAQKDAVALPVPHVIISSIEHASVFQLCEHLQRQGRIALSICKVDGDGIVDLAQLQTLIRTGETVLASIMHGNNEIGTVQPLEAIGAICRQRGVLFHTDACQTFLKTSLATSACDLITLNAHKLHGPKGVGALYIADHALKLIDAQQVGGGQEAGYRSGTLNVPGIAGFGAAVAVGLKHMAANQKHMRQLRDHLYKEVVAQCNSVSIRLNGPHLESESRLCNNLNLSFGGPFEGDALVSRLSDQRVFVSTGSACASTGMVKGSRVLLNSGRPEREAVRTLRFSLSPFTTPSQIAHAVTALASIFNPSQQN